MMGFFRWIWDQIVSAFEWAIDMIALIMITIWDWFAPVIDQLWLALKEIADTSAYKIHPTPDSLDLKGINCFYLITQICPNFFFL